METGATQGQEEGLFHSLYVELWRYLIQELKKGNIIAAFASWRLQKEKYSVGISLWNRENPVQVYRLFISSSVENGKDDKEMGTKPCCHLLLTACMCWPNKRVKEKITD